jgi:thioredoxin-dependent peroxiredoxin
LIKSYLVFEFRLNCGTGTLGDRKILARGFSGFFQDGLTPFRLPRARSQQEAIGVVYHVKITQHGTSMLDKLHPGAPAPDFTAIAVGGCHGEGESISLSSLYGKTVVLYFYPKDDTPGCTTQACDLRENYNTIIAKGAVIYGVSIDSPPSHAKFLSKYHLPFPLFSDEPKAIVNAYGVWVEKSMYGKKYMGTERATFVIGPDGNIKAIHRKIPPSAHVSTILKDL